MSGTGVFCLHPEWGKNLRTRLSVEPQLVMLKETGVATSPSGR